jgi:hypothetical protein
MHLQDAGVTYSVPLLMLSDLLTRCKVWYASEARSERGGTAASESEHRSATSQIFHWHTRFIIASHRLTHRFRIITLPSTSSTRQLRAS